MFALRSIARSAPRTSLRIASYSTRSALRPSTQLAIRSQPQVQLPRFFSACLARRDAIAQELAAKLQQELDLESEEGQAESDSNIAAFKDNNPAWTFEDKDGEQEVFLHRKYEDEDITVSFSIVDFNTPSMIDDEHDDALMDDEEDIDTQSGGANTKGAINQGRTSGGNVKIAPEDRVAPGDREELRDVEDDMEGEGQSFAANVSVLVQRKGKGALRIHLIADSGEFSIQSVAHLPADKASDSSSPVELIREPFDTSYSGPPFQQLDEDVQTMLESYLDARGINAALAVLIPEYIDVKEQKEYLGWLNRVKEFVD